LSNRFTVITLNAPDPAQIAWAIAEVDPQFVLAVDPGSERWEVYDEEQSHLLFTIDEPYLVQVPGEIERLFGSNVGLDLSALPEEPATYWQDINVTTPGPGESAAAQFAELAAHLGLGTAVDHQPVPVHLGAPDAVLRPEWRI
jgi:hypothetical protein